MLQSQNLVLLQDDSVDNLQSFFHIKGLQQFLLGGNLYVHLHCDGIGEYIRLLDRTYKIINLFLNCRIQLYVFIKGVEHRPHSGLYLKVFLVCRNYIRLLYSSLNVRFLCHYFLQGGSVLAVYQHSYGIPLYFKHLFNLDYRSHMIIIIRCRYQYVFVLLRSYKKQLVAVHSSFKSFD